MARVPAGSVPAGSQPSLVSWRALVRRYWIDWLTLVLLIILTGCLEVLHPYERYVNEYQLQYLRYPLKHNSVPTAAVPVIGLLVPAVFLVAFFAIRRDKGDLHQSLLGLLFTCAFAALVTISLKNGVGRPRPDFFWRCFPNGVPVFGSDGNVACTGTPSVVREGYMSFPSGHSSWSFAGLGYLSLFLAGKIRAFDGRGHLGKVLLVSLPVVGAIAVGITRVDDYWHHWSDVVAGAAIGLVIAGICYRQHYPALNDAHCDVPYMAHPSDWLSSTPDVETGH